MFDPTMLPTAMPGEPASEACTLVTSSGVEVPKPTSVSPISSGETPIRSAICTAPRTSPSPPRASRTSPPMINPAVSMRPARSDARRRWGGAPGQSTRAPLTRMISA